ncbi:MAG: hypothetical protein PHH49_07640 [Candidatus Omnitrophica bacterium]|nr:hypothetical protein [Candidatus Omnitrophota bacterium]MDD5488808.1 hypothetical protein [Candidatus Omnitrophota bacterium]
MSIISSALKKAQDKRSSERSYGTLKGDYDHSLSERSTRTDAAYLQDPRRIHIWTGLTLPLSISLIAVLLCILVAAVFFHVNNVPAPVSDPRPLPPSYTASRSSRPGTRATRETPVLTGIMYSDHDPKAVINGTMVPEGALVDGFHVIKIFPDKVKIVSEDFSEELDLKLRG